MEGAIPQWLVVAAQIAEVLFNGAIGLAVIGFGIKIGPKLLGALRGWHDIMTAKLQAERDVERRLREAAESTAKLHAASVATVTSEVESLRRQLATAEEQASELTASLSERERAVFQSVYYTLAHAIALEAVSATNEVIAVLTLDLLSYGLGAHLSDELATFKKQALQLTEANRRFVAQQGRMGSLLSQQLAEQASTLARSTGRGDEMLNAAYRIIAGTEYIVGQAKLAQRFKAQVPLMQQHILPHRPSEKLG